MPVTILCAISQMTSGMSPCGHLGPERRRVLSACERMGGPRIYSLREFDHGGPRGRGHSRAGTRVAHRGPR